MLFFTVFTRGFVMKNTKFSFSLFLALLFSIAATDFAHAMKRNLPPSPTKVERGVSNYCKNIIVALQKDDIEQVKKEFHSFFNKKISYPMHIAQLEFYQALSLCLCRCLSNAQPMYAINTGTVAVAVKSRTKKYILQFRTLETDEAIQPDPIYTYSLDRTDEGIEVIAISFLIGKETVKPKNKEPELKNKRAILKMNIIENIGDELFELVAKENLAKLEYNSDNLHTTIIDQLTENNIQDPSLNENLLDFYAYIPQELRIQNEKFYQSMLYWIITFYRSSFVSAEHSTSRGRADIVISAENCNSVIEFKFNHTAREALSQIRNRDYSGYFEDDLDSKQNVEIGINIKIDADTDQITVTSIRGTHQSVSPSPMKKQNTKK